MADKYIVAVDLGTSKIALIVANIDDDNNTNIIYYKDYKSEGISRGAVRNPSKVADIIKLACNEAEEKLDIEIRKIILSYPKYHIRQEEIEQSTDLKEDDTISREIISNLKSMASSSFDDKNDKEEIYETISQNFSTDEFFNQEEDDVIGMISSTIKGSYNLYIGSKSCTKNIDRAMNNIELAVAKTYFAPSILANICLSKEDKNNGIAMIDIGAGVSSVSIYSKNILRYYASIPFGADHISLDICSEAGINKNLADELKIAFGSCLANNLGTLSEKILIISDQNRQNQKQISVKYLAEIIEARTREIISALLYKIEESGYADKLGNGIALTGGGAKLLNLNKLVEEMSGYTVSRVYPRKGITSYSDVSYDDSSASLAIGLIVAAKEDNISFSYSKDVTDNPMIETEKEENVEQSQLFEADEKEKEDIERRRLEEEIRRKEERRKKEQKEKKKNKTTSFKNLFSKIGEALTPEDDNEV